MDIKLASETGSWVTLEMASISSWAADPVEKHVAFGTFGTLWGC
jgi:hypothetical protein